MVKIDSLRLRVDGKEVLRGIDLSIGAGEVHVIMGPNGSGKSTLASALVGKPGYEVTDGSMSFLGKDIADMLPEERAASGIFMAFQYPVEIPGVSTMNFLKTAVNETRKYNGLPALNAVDFLKMVKERSELVGMSDKLLSRSLNENFSGGEKKRNEILQMAMLEPRLAILDETDSGLDIDALKMVGRAVSALRDGNRSMMIITHYPRILEYVQPDFVHILYRGRIVESGDRSLADRLEREGYDWVINNE